MRTQLLYQISTNIFSNNDIFIFIFRGQKKLCIFQKGGKKSEYAVNIKTDAQQIDITDNTCEMVNYFEKHLFRCTSKMTRAENFRMVDIGINA